MENPIVHSLIVAVVATIIGFIIVLPLSYWGAYYKYPGKWLVEIFLLLPLVLPPTIVGLLILRLFGRYGVLGSLLESFGYSIIFSLTGAIAATTIVIIPLLYQGIKGALVGVPRDLIQVAKTLAANQREVLFRIILPTCWPSIVASILLAFCRGLGEFGASLMVAGYIEGRTDTLATSIYFAVQQGDNHKAALLSVINIGIGLLILLIIQLLTAKRQGEYL
ncbi:molybdate ABC transporter permease subunit [Enterococcus sp. AZ109]|uniref:molybdate ABC transporter permease subunit n=1 Tax=Enterococcus sp. AZ109 TaxID=2774634 RepID=UPI003F2428FF